MVTELLANGSYVDVGLLLLIVFSFISAVVAQEKTKKKIEETEKKIADLKRYQEGVSEGLDKRYVSLKKALVDKMNKLTAKLNAILKSNETVMLEIDNKIKPLKASIDDSVDEVKDTGDTLKKTVLENKEEMKKMEKKMAKEISDFSKEIPKMAKEISDFSKEIQKMKDDIRERTIDLEL